MSSNSAARFVSLVAVAAALAGSGAAQEKTIIVAPHKAPVTGVFPGMCLLVSDEGETQWRPLRDPIEGFVYEWGYRYKLSVAEEPGSGALRLVKVLNQRDARQGYTFEIPLTVARVVPAPEDTFYLCGEKQFACGEGVDREGFAKAIASGARLSCKFRFADDPTQPLVLLAWSPVGDTGTPLAPGSRGQAIPSDVPPLLRAGRTLVPLRAIFEWLGAKVDYEAGTQGITATKGAHVVHLRIGSANASVDGEAVELDVAALETHGRTFVPLRFVSEALDAKVDWDAGSRTVTVTDGQRVGTLNVR